MRVKELIGQSGQLSQLANLANHLTDGNIVTLAENINSFFHSISSDLNPLDIEHFFNLPDNDILLDDLVIEPFSVERKLAINTHKSPGPDGISNWFLRDFSVLLAEPICCIFNTSLRTGSFPCLWKQANVIPVPKVNPPQAIESDLRPISLSRMLVTGFCLVSNLSLTQCNLVHSVGVPLPMLWSTCCTHGIKPWTNTNLPGFFLWIFPKLLTELTTPLLSIS